MKFKLQMKKFKVVAILGLALSVVIPGAIFMNLGTNADEVDGNPMSDVMPIHTISRNSGNGEFGQHTYPNYVEGGVQYYRTGDIIEVNVQLPKGHGSTAVHDVVAYDNKKVELLSPYNNIRNSLAANYTGRNWFLDVSTAPDMESGISLDAMADDGGQSESAKDFEGGTIAKIYFKVLPNVESEAGTPIEFSFPQFQTLSYVNGGIKYTHKDYDPNNNNATYMYNAGSVAIVAKTPTVAVNAPTMNLKADKVTIFEGDLFDPSSQVRDCSDDNDASITREAVTISEGSGTYSKHQPTAGTYVYKYSVTSSTGLSTEKSLTLTVTPRTYEVSAIKVDDKTITVKAGTSSKDLEAKIEQIKAKDFDVSVKSNDGTTFVVPGKVISGTTDTYLVDENDKLLEQEFNVTYKLGLPLVSYNAEGKRVVTPYSGTTRFTSNVGTGQANAIVHVRVTAAGAGTGNNGNSSGSTAGNGSGNNNAAGAGSAASTGDTTDANALMLLAALSAVTFIGFKFKKQTNK